MILDRSKTLGETGRSIDFHQQLLDSNQRQTGVNRLLKPTLRRLLLVISAELQPVMLDSREAILAVAGQGPRAPNSAAHDIRNRPRR